MLIIVCDYHPSVQQIAFVDTDTGELSEQRLAHREQAEQFYRELKQGLNRGSEIPPMRPNECASKRPIDRMRNRCCG